MTGIEAALTLPRYAGLIEYSACMFYGVYDSNSPGYACREYWSQPQRETAARYLIEAQIEIENVIKYPLKRRWFGDGQCEDDVQSWRATGMYRAKRGHIVKMGTRAETEIVAGAAIDHTNDPASVGPITTTVSPDELRLYHPGTDTEIFPCRATTGGGAVTFEIPRCHLVKLSAAFNDPTRPMSYNDTGVGGIFEQTIDIKRVYTDGTTHAVLRYGDGATQAVGVVIRNSQLGLLCVEGMGGRNWCSPGGGWPVEISFNYYAGVRCLNFQQEDTILRLAHAKMPNAICSCEVWQNLWRRDRFVPEVLTRERLNCPFGMNDGAWTAWKFAQSFRLMRGGVV